MRKRGVVAGTVSVAVITAAALRGFLRRFTVREQSMAPTLADGDWVIGRRRTGDLRRGDVVVVSDPTGSGIDLVKRVIGLPGEQVGVASGRVTVNGALLADRWANGNTRPDGSWDIPSDHVWLLGDNRGISSSDGRILGATPISDIGWVVVARYWPRNRIGML